MKGAVEVDGFTAFFSTRTGCEIVFALLQLFVKLVSTLLSLFSNRSRTSWELFPFGAGDDTMEIFEDKVLGYFIPMDDEVPTLSISKMGVKKEKKTMLDSIPILGRLAPGVAPICEGACDRLIASYFFSCVS